MADRITLRGLQVHAFHGAYPAEAAEGQTFLVDVELELDLAAAAGSDDLGDTVDYSGLAADITSVVAGERWNLIERVAGRVADVALGHPRVAGARVTIHKPNAPMPYEFSDVSVTLYRTR